MNALKNRKSEYLESLLLENFQDEWEVDPKDLSYNVEDTLGQGSFGLVCRGRLARLTTPAAEYLHLAPTSTSGDSASAGVGRPSSTQSTSGSKNWITSILPKRLRRGSGANGDAQGMDVAVKVSHNSDQRTSQLTRCKFVSCVNLPSNFKLQLLLLNFGSNCF